MMAGWSMSTEAWIWLGAWALVMIVVVWLLVREPRHDRPPDPAATLRDRFARGEISEQELRRALSALDESAGPPTDADHRHAARHATPGREARHD